MDSVDPKIAKYEAVIAALEKAKLGSDNFSSESEIQDKICEEI